MSNTSTQSDARRSISTSQQKLSSQDAGHQPAGSQFSEQTRAPSALLQIPDGNATRRPVETSIWDWDTPLDSIGESSSYYYEPQGELAHEQLEQVPTRKEFSIPHAVAGASVSRRTSGGASGSDSNGGFAVPKKPVGVPSSLAGTKRKSPLDPLSSNTGKQPAEKGVSLAMPDAEEELGSPVGGRAPAHSTRSQTAPTGPGARMRSNTDTTENRSRTSIPESGPGQGQGGAPGLRRTVTDPAASMALPARKVFPIQIGDKLFRLSGASISSDGE